MTTTPKKTVARIAPAGPMTEIAEITPTLAAAWLERNHPENRSIAWPRVEAFANDMRADAWQVTHQGIAFDGDGRLIDGQHRLQAVVQSGVTVRMLVVRGVGSFGDPIDCGRPRSIAMLSGLGTRVTAALNGLRALETGYWIQTPMSLHDAHEIHGHHAAALEAVAQARGMSRGAGGLWAAAAYAYPLDPEKVGEFLNAVGTGEMLKRGDPAFAYRNWNERQPKIGTWLTALAACACIRSHLFNESLAMVYTEPTGYRILTQKRRAARLPWTPKAEAVPALGGGARKGTPRGGEEA